jgi:hypothetical protein
MISAHQLEIPNLESLQFILLESTCALSSYGTSRQQQHVWKLTEYRFWRP